MLAIPSSVIMRHPRSPSLERFEQCSVRTFKPKNDGKSVKMLLAKRMTCMNNLPSSVTSHFPTSRALSLVPIDVAAEITPAAFEEEEREQI